MIEFRLNLIRDQVPNAEQRRIRYMAMLVYLAAAGLALVVAVSLASSRLIKASELRSQTQSLEDLFNRSHEGQGGVVATTARLQGRLAAQVGSLQSTDRLLASDARPARLIRALVLSLPPGVSLRSFKLTHEDQSVLLELRAMEGSESQGGQAELLDQWQKDAVIKAELNDISFVGSQMENVAGRNDLVWRFTGRLAGGGG